MVQLAVLKEGDLESRVAEGHRTRGRGPAAWHRDTVPCLPVGGRAPQAPASSCSAQRWEEPQAGLGQARLEVACDAVH